MKIRLIKFIDRLMGGILTTCLPSASVRPIPVPRRILLIRPGGIGDAVLFTPTILHLANIYPEAKLTVLAEKRNSAIFRLCPAISKVLQYDKPGELLTAIRGHYDVVIDSEQWYYLSAVVARLTKSPMKIGFSTNNRKKLFTHPVPYAQEMYEADCFATLLGPLGLPKPFLIEIPFLTLPDAAVAESEKLLAPLSGKPFVAVFPGASTPEKLWGTGRFRQLVSLLNKRGLKVVIVGGRDDFQAGEVIAKGNDVLNLAGRSSLSVTGALIHKGAALISGDSGLLHMAVGLGVPAIAIFGPSDPGKWGPRHGKHAVVCKRLPCSPCARFGSIPRCTFNGACLVISADEVFKQVIEQLDIAQQSESARMRG
jgi:ADP-heptose:LPS heptosyltransferase